MSLCFLSTCLLSPIIHDMRQLNELGGLGFRQELLQNQCLNELQRTCCLRDLVLISRMFIVTYVVQFEHKFALCLHRQS